MKVLLDENLPHRLRLALQGHEVATVAYMVWAGLKNGELLRAAEAASLEVFVKDDKKLLSQQIVTGRKIGVVVLFARKIDQLRPHIQAINRSEQQGKVSKVDCRRVSAN